MKIDKELALNNIENLNIPAINEPVFYCVYCKKEFDYDNLYNYNINNKEGILEETGEMVCNICNDKLPFNI